MTTVNNKNIMESATNGYLDLQLSVDEVKELMAILQFTITAGKIMSDQEMIKGTYKGAAKMNNYVHHAARLLEVVVAAAQIGYTPDDPIN